MWIIQQYKLFFALYWHFLNILTENSCQKSQVTNTQKQNALSVTASSKSHNKKADSTKASWEFKNAQSAENTNELPWLSALLNDISVWF